jgi:MYXO-CTERM domain-containing protein
MSGTGGGSNGNGGANPGAGGGIQGGGSATGGGSNGGCGCRVSGERDDASAAFWAGALLAMWIARRKLGG